MNISYKKASFLERLAAFIVDLFIITILWILLLYIASLFSFNIDKYKILDFIFALLYFILFTWIAGATPGKMLLKLKVVSNSYKHVNFWQILYRETIGKWISGLILSLGYLWMVIDKNNQTWHDKIASTYVVKLGNSGQFIPAGSTEILPKSRRIILWTILLFNPLSLATYFLFIYIFLFRPFKMTGESMYPTLQNKEYIATNVIAMKLSPLKRGEIIVLKSPNDPEKDFIKRVIGVPGDRIMLQNGIVYLNGQILDESSYLLPNIRTFGGAVVNESQEITVPPDSYFVLGDNRPFSSDSREWGFVPKKNIISTVMFCYWNCQNKHLGQADN